MAITPVTSGSSTPVPTPVTDEGAQVRRGGSLDLRPQQAQVHEALVSRRTDSMPHLAGAGESAERPRLNLDTLKTSTPQTPQRPPSTSADGASPRELTSQLTFKHGVPDVTTPPQSLPPIQTTVQVAEPLAKHSPTSGASTSTGDASPRVLMSFPTFKDGVGEASTPTQSLPPVRSTAQSPEHPTQHLLRDTNERSHRFSVGPSTPSEPGRHLSAGAGEPRPSGRSSVPSSPRVSTPMSRISARGDSSSSGHISSAGVGERRPSGRVSNFSGSQLPSPMLSQRFALSSSGEQQMSRLSDASMFMNWSGSESGGPESGGLRLEGAPTSTANWRAAIAELVQTVRQQAVQTASVVTVLSPPPRLLAAAAGHIAHQAVAVGIPTFAREMLAQGLMAALHTASPQAAIGLQAGMLVVNIGLQVVREQREARNPDEAARGFHALSPEQWEQSSPQQQAEMRDTQARHSRLITVLQVASSVSDLVLTGVNVRNGDATSAIQRATTGFKTGIYTTMRDTLQASFRMVGIVGDTHGTSGPHLTAAIATYAGVAGASNYVSDVLLAATAPERSTATAVLNGVLSTGAAGMSTGAAWGTAVTAAGTKAALNTVVEAIDWFQRTQHEANQGGTVQQLAPRINIAPEHRDYGRLLDHMPGRLAVINSINAATGLAGHFASNSSAALQSLIGNAGSAVVTFLTDYSLSSTFQADAAVRTATSASPESPPGFNV
jgi:hypothetical protein